MRRPRPHRHTGQVRRLLAAAVLGALATVAVAATTTSEPAAAAGVTLNVDLNLPSAALPSVPSLFPTFTPPTAPPTSVPGGAALPVLCPPTCSNPGAGKGTSGGGGNAPGTPRTTGPGSSTSTPGSGTSVSFGSNPSSGPAGGSTVSRPQALGLSVAPPPPVDQLTPLAGISFGQAPYLWPLFLLLDVIAAGVVVGLLVRRNWSPSSGAD